MFRAERETAKGIEFEEYRRGVASLWATSASGSEAPSEVFRDRSPTPGRLNIEVNSYFSQEEVNDITCSCADNFDSARRNEYVCEKLLEIARQKDEYIRWLTACGSHWITAQIQPSKDLIFLADFGPLIISVFKGSYKGGRVAPISEDSPGAAFKHPKTIDAERGSPRELTASVLKHIFLKNEMMIPVKLCSEAKSFLAHNDRSANWLVVSGRSFHVSCENNLENKCVAHFSELRGAKLIALRTQRMRRLALENGAHIRD